MAEFCLDCENKRIEAEGYEPIPEGAVILDDDFCEDCGEWKPCIVAYRPWYHGPRKKAQEEESGPGLLELFRRAKGQLFGEARRRQKKPTDKQLPA